MNTVIISGNSGSGKTTELLKHFINDNDAAFLSDEMFNVNIIDFILKLYPSKTLDEVSTMYIHNIRYTPYLSNTFKTIANILKTYENKRITITTLCIDLSHTYNDDVINLLAHALSNLGIANLFVTRRYSMGKPTKGLTIEQLPEMI